MKKLLTWITRGSKPRKKGSPRAPTAEAHTFALRNVRRKLETIEQARPLARVDADLGAAAPIKRAKAEALKKDPAAVPPKKKIEAADPKHDLEIAIPSTKKPSDLLAELRSAFEKGNWQETQAVYEKMQGPMKRSQNLRVEATCLAARARTARKERSAARAMLKRIGSEVYPKATHYDFLAHAFLDLRNYDEAIRCCEQARTMRSAKDAR